MKRITGAASLKYCRGRDTTTLTKDCPVGFIRLGNSSNMLHLGGFDYAKRKFRTTSCFMAKHQNLMSFIDSFNPDLLDKDK